MLLYLAKAQEENPIIPLVKTNGYSIDKYTLKVLMKPVITSFPIKYLNCEMVSLKFCN